MRKYLFPIVFISASVVMFILAALFQKNTKDFLASSVEGRGVVIEMARNSKDWLSLAPRIRFVTDADLEVVFLSNVYSRPPAYEVGESVIVLYNPEDPKESVRIKSFFSLWGVQLVLCAISSVFFILGFIFVYFIRNG